MPHPLAGVGTLPFFCWHANASIGLPPGALIMEFQFKFCMDGWVGQCNDVPGQVVVVLSSWSVSPLLRLRFDLALISFLELISG